MRIADLTFKPANLSEGPGIVLADVVHAFRGAHYRSNDDCQVCGDIPAFYPFGENPAYCMDCIVMHALDVAIYHFDIESNRRVTIVEGILEDTDVGICTRLMAYALPTVHKNTNADTIDFSLTPDLDSHVFAFYDHNHVAVELKTLYDAVAFTLVREALNEQA